MPPRRPLGSTVFPVPDEREPPTPLDRLHREITTSLELMILSGDDRALDEVLCRLRAATEPAQDTLAQHAPEVAGELTCAVDHLQAGEYDEARSALLTARTSLTRVIIGDRRRHRHHDDDAR